MDQELSTTPYIPQPKSEKVRGVVREFVILAVIMAFIFLVFRPYVAQTFIVRGESMYPTFVNNEYMIVDELTYHFREPARNDVVIFRYPNYPETFYIKRIIGLPGESLSMKDGKITLTNKDFPKGFIFDDSHVNKEIRTYDTLDITLGNTEYFVMGDNRANSSDSRLWGPLERKHIMGRPFVTMYPLNKIGFFPGK